MKKVLLIGSILTLTVGMFAFSGTVLAATSITNIDLDGGNNVTVAAGQSIAVTVTAYLASGINWRGTEYHFVGSGGYSSCENTTDFIGSGSYTVNFTVSAPTHAGTYDFDIKIREKNDCTGYNTSDHLNDGVIVQARVTSSATLNGASSVTVAPGASITAAVTGIIAHDYDYHANEWRINTSPGSMTCDGSTADHNSGTFTENSTITAPVTPGTYNAYFRVNGSNDCDSSQKGTLLTLSSAITVSQPISSTTLSVNSVTGTYGDTVNLVATLTKTSGGGAVSGKSILFTLNGVSKGSATTTISGVATLPDVSLVGISTGFYATWVGASFAGDTGYTASSGTGSLTVNKRNITVTAATNSKTYDGTTSAVAVPTITSGTLVIVGLDGIGGDTATWTETYDNKNVGTGKTLTPAGTVNDGNSGNNYTVTFVNDTTGIITPKPLTVTASSQSKTVGQTLHFVGTEFTTSGLVGGDSVTNVTLTSAGEDSSATVGFYDILSSAAVGTGLENYTITYAKGTLTVNDKITPVIIWSNPADITYPTSLSMTQLNATASVGEVPIAGTFNYTPVLGTVLSAGDSQSLHVDFTPDDTEYYNNVSADVKINVLKKELTISAIGQDRIYDGTKDATVTLSDNRVEGDILTVNYGSANFTDKNVGDNKPVVVVGITVSGASAGNYSFSNTVDTTADITPELLTITADSQNKTFGQTLIFAGTEFTTNGLVPEDSVTSVTLASDGAGAGAYAGNYDIVPSEAVGSGLDNYSITYVNGTLTVVSEYVQSGSSILLVPEDTLALCSDNNDNDRNGLTDLADPNCAPFLPAVLGTSTSTVEETSTSTVGEVLGTSTECLPPINQFLYFGGKNDPAEVTKLQEFLNSSMGANLTVNGIFDLPTLKAVKDFQLRFKILLLRPWLKYGHPDENTPTGNVFKLTRWLINILRCPSSGQLMPTLP